MNRNKLGTLAAAACIALGLLAVAGCRTEARRDAATGCMPSLPRPVTVLAVDITEPFTPRQRELVKLVVKRSWAQVPAEGELRVHALDGGAAETVPRLVLCREPEPGLLDGPKTKEFKASVQRREHLDEAVQALAEALSASTGVSAQAQGSRLYEWASGLSGTLGGAYTARRLVLISDLRQFSPRFRNNASLPDNGVDFARFELIVVVLGEGLHAAPSPWPRLFQASGAANIEVAIDSLPGSMLR